ncbi:hypothetical protein Dimus_020293, partial [Dionaea muscipula]
EIMGHVLEGGVAIGRGFLSVCNMLRARRRSGWFGWLVGDSLDTIEAVRARCRACAKIVGRKQLFSMLATFVPL